MKKIMKTFVLFYIACLLLVSCPYSTTATFEQKIIAEYPVWCSWTDKNKDPGDAVTGFGYSEWKDWQGNEGDSTPVRFYDENHSEFSRLVE